MFKFLRKMFNKESGNISTDATITKVPACKDCEWHYNYSKGSIHWCNIPLGTFRETFDPVNGTILLKLETLNDQCEYERTRKSDDMNKGRVVCGREGRNFKAKKVK